MFAVYVYALKSMFFVLTLYCCIQFCTILNETNIALIIILVADMSGSLSRKVTVLCLALMLDIQICT